MREVTLRRKCHHPRLHPWISSHACLGPQLNLGLLKNRRPVWAKFPHRSETVPYLSTSVLWKICTKNEVKAHVSDSKGFHNSRPTEICQEVHRYFVPLS
ncbi:hypothetical protein I7I48_09556 [Histoplasma ohiense]|nr:hypothetical protein I7I48_09556 [Histoplasma ohiense (nom. inval.)]